MEQRCMVLTEAFQGWCMLHQAAQKVQGTSQRIKFLMSSAYSSTLWDLQGEVWKRRHTSQSLGDSTGGLEGHGREQSFGGAGAADEEEKTADIGLQNCNRPLWVHMIWHSPHSCGPNCNKQSSKLWCTLPALQSWFRTHLQPLALANNLAFRNALVTMQPKSTTLDLPTSYGTKVHIHNMFVKHMKVLKEAIIVSHFTLLALMYLFLSE